MTHYKDSLGGIEGIEEVRTGRKLNIWKRHRRSTSGNMVSGGSAEHQKLEDMTIFFLPGSLACHEIVRDIIKYFALTSSVNLVAYDAYGSGKSDRPRDWDESGNLIGHYSNDALFHDAKAILAR